jgi:1,4-dihydroxy-2-naphthoate polyprenyltransferase
MNIIMKHWAQIVRAQYLTLPIVLSLLGNAYAYYEGNFQWSTAILALIGLMLAHMSVNVINDYFDYQSGIDLKTKRSPFSGGSGSIVEGIIKPKTALVIGLSLLIIAAVIGVYFVLTVSWQLIILLAISAFFVIAYSPLILKRRMGEWSAGLGLGAFPVIGTIFVQMGFYSWEMLAVSLPSAILVHNLLLLNEIPDQEADKSANRKTFPILYGPQATIRYYVFLSLLMYIFISAGVSLGILPLLCILSFFVAPMVFSIQKIANNSEALDFSRILPLNVAHIHLTQLLLALAFLVTRWLF